MHVTSPNFKILNILLEASQEPFKFLQIPTLSILKLLGNPHLDELMS